jgi:hypothetical protein
MLAFNPGLAKSKGFTDGQLFEAQSLRLSPRMNFTYEYGELLTINPSYNLTYNQTDYTNYLVTSAATVVHKFNLQTTNYWPKNWVFGNDFGYTYNSNIADGFKKDFYLWNSSLAYSFYKKKITAKVKVYDLLNQNQATTRRITPTSIRDEENVVLKRYVMFSLSYKIEKFAGKKSQTVGVGLCINKKSDLRQDFLFLLQFLAKTPAAPPYPYCEAFLRSAQKSPAILLLIR